MLRQRLVAYRKLWIPALAVSLALATVLVVGSLFNGDQASAAPSQGVTERVSVKGANTQLNQESRNPAISADGRFVAFDTLEAIDDLDKDNDGEEYESSRESDIYVRDTVLKKTVWVSHGINVDGDARARAPSTANSFRPSISADGRFIAFETISANIPESGAGNQSRIVVCDRNPDGVGPLADECVYTKVSRNGDLAFRARMSDSAQLVSYEFVALAEEAVTKIVLATLNRTPEGTIPVPNNPDDFVDVAGPPSLDIDGDGDGDLEAHTLYGFGSSTLSANGTHLAFAGAYGVDNSRAGVVFDFDVAAGTLTRIDSRGGNGPVARNNKYFFEVALSGDGRRIAFREDVVNTTSDTPFIHLFDRDPDGNGQFGPSGLSGNSAEPFRVEVASRNVNNASASGIMPAFSADGRYLAFVTDAPDMHNGTDVPVGFSCIHPIILEGHELPADPRTGGEPAALEAPAALPAEAPAHPAPAFAPAHAPGPSISACDVVVRDLIVDRARELAGQPRLLAELASPSAGTTCDTATASPTQVPAGTCQGNDDSESPVLSGNGSAVAFSSDATDLIQGEGNTDTNNDIDVYLRRFTPTVRGDAVDFGEVPLNTPPKQLPVTVQHVGFGPLQIKSISIGGANATDFTIMPPENQNCLGVTLHGTEQCVVGVEFAPTALGARSAVLQVTLANTPTGTPPVGIPLRGVGIPEPPPGFEANPEAVAFGDRGVLFPSAPQAVTITNTGEGRMRITDVKFTGTAPVSFPGDYTITANTCTGTILASGGTCQVTIVHKPRAVGNRPSVLEFTEGFEESTTHTVNVTGGGTPPLLTASPALNPAGQVSQVKGTNFPPGSTVTVQLDKMVGNPIVVVVGANGEFTVPLLIFPHTATGKHLLRATVTLAPSPGLDAPLVATFDYLVVPGSLQPPDFAVRK